ncbi:MAG: hypothetical protein SOW62_06830, partial [Sodaliphilus sp.]|nr:hypothetical protein [Sodaliphilus sp.]
SNSFHTKKRFPKNRENASIAVIFFQKNAPCPQKSPKNTYIFSAFDTSRPRQIVDIQYDTTIMGGREVSRPYRVWFFAEGERFLSTALTTGAKHRHP